MDAELGGGLGDRSPIPQERRAKFVSGGFGYGACSHGYYSNQSDYGCQPGFCNHL